MSQPKRASVAAMGPGASLFSAAAEASLPHNDLHGRQPSIARSSSSMLPSLLPVVRARSRPIATTPQPTPARGLRSVLNDDVNDFTPAQHQRSIVAHLAATAVKPHGPRSLSMAPDEERQFGRRLMEFGQLAIDAGVLSQAEYLRRSRRIPQGPDRGRVVQRSETQAGFGPAATHSRVAGALVPLHPKTKKLLTSSDKNNTVRTVHPVRLAPHHGIMVAASMGYEKYAAAAGWTRDSSPLSSPGLTTPGDMGRSPVTGSQPDFHQGANASPGAGANGGSQSSPGLQAGRDLRSFLPPVRGSDPRAVREQRRARIAEIRRRAEEEGADSLSDDEDELIRCFERDETFMERFYDRIPLLSDDAMSRASSAAAEEGVTGAAKRRPVPLHPRGKELHLARSRFAALVGLDGAKTGSITAFPSKKAVKQTVFIKLLLDPDLQLGTRDESTRAKKKKGGHRALPTLSDKPQLLSGAAGALLRAQWLHSAASDAPALHSLATPDTSSSEFQAIVLDLSCASAPWSQTILRAVAELLNNVGISTRTVSHRSSLSSAAACDALKANIIAAVSPSCNHIIVYCSVSGLSDGESPMDASVASTDVSLGALLAGLRREGRTVIVIGDATCSNAPKDATAAAERDDVQLPGCAMTYGTLGWILQDETLLLTCRSPCRQRFLVSYYALKALEGGVCPADVARVAAFVQDRLSRRHLPDSDTQFDVDKFDTADPTSFCDESLLPVPSEIDCKAVSKILRSYPVVAEIVVAPTILWRMSGPAFLTRVANRVKDCVTASSHDAIKNTNEALVFGARRRIDGLHPLPEVLLEGLPSSLFMPQHGFNWPRLKIALSHLATGHRTITADALAESLDETHVVDFDAVGRTAVLRLAKRIDVFLRDNEAPTAAAPSTSEEGLTHCASQEQSMTATIRLRDPTDTSPYLDAWVSGILRLIDPQSGVLQGAAGETLLTGIQVRQRCSLRYRGSAQHLLRITKHALFGTLDVGSCCFCRVDAVKDVRDAGVDVIGDAVTSIQSVWKGFFVRKYIKPRVEQGHRMLRKQTVLWTSGIANHVNTLRQLFDDYQDSMWDAVLSEEVREREWKRESEAILRTSLFDRRVHEWPHLEHRCRNAVMSEWLFGFMMMFANHETELLYFEASRSTQSIIAINDLFVVAYKARQRVITDEYAARCNLRKGAVGGVVEALRTEQIRLKARAKIRKDKIALSAATSTVYSASSPQGLLATPVPYTTLLGQPRLPAAIEMDRSATNSARPSAAGGRSSTSSDDDDDDE